MKNIRVAGAVFAKPSDKVIRVANAKKIPTEPIEDIIEKNEIFATNETNETKVKNRK